MRLVSRIYSRPAEARATNLIGKRRKLIVIIEVHPHNSQTHNTTQHGAEQMYFSLLHLKRMRLVSRIYCRPAEARATNLIGKRRKLIVIIEVHPHNSQTHNTTQHGAEQM